MCAYIACHMIVDAMEKIQRDEACAAMWSGSDFKQQGLVEPTGMSYHRLLFLHLGLKPRESLIHERKVLCFTSRHDL